MTNNKPLTTLSQRLDDLHPSQNFRQLDSPAVDARFDRADGDLEYVYNLLIGQLLDVAQDHAFAQIGLKFGDRGMHLVGALESLDPAIGRVVARFEVVLMIAYIVPHVGRGSAAPAVIIDYQIAGEPHQPIGQVAGLRVVLVE